MDWGSVIIATVLFVCFVPGVLFKIPIQDWRVRLLAHGVSFAIVTHYAMRYYLFREFMENYSCKEE